MSLLLTRLFCVVGRTYDNCIEVGENIGELKF